MNIHKKASRLLLVVLRNLPKHVPIAHLVYRIETAENALIFLQLHIGRKRLGLNQPLLTILTFIKNRRYDLFAPNLFPCFAGIDPEVLISL